MQNGPEEQKNPLFIHSVVKGGLYVGEFAKVLERVAENTLLNPDTFGSWYHTAAHLYSKDVTPERFLHNSDGRDFSFDLNRTGEIHTDDNLSFKDYITAKITAWKGYMAKLEEYLQYQRPIPARYFIRGDFNDWSNRDEYALTPSGDQMVFTLNFRHDFSFKVYDDQTQAWYGAECLPEDTELDFRTNDHGNIILRSGTYEVTFDPETTGIQIIKK
jgi:hypothetical protein